MDTIPDAEKENPINAQELQNKTYVCGTCRWEGKAEDAHNGLCPKCWMNNLEIKEPNKLH